jgi:hypothetical protein
MPTVLQDNNLVLGHADGSCLQIHFSQSLQLIGQEVESNQVLLIQTQEV